MSVEIDNRGWAWIIGGGLTFLVAVLLWVMQASVEGENVFTEAALSEQVHLALSCVHEDQCERPASKKFIAEVQNTFSNLAYLLFGVCAIVRSTRARATADARPAPAMFGLALCFLAACSAWYHGSLNYDSTLDKDKHDIIRHLLTNSCPAEGEHFDDAPQVWDIMGVYLAMMMLILHGVDHLFRKYDLGRAAEGKTVTALIVGGIMVVATVVVCGLLGGLAAAAGVAALLAIISILLVRGARIANNRGAVWLSWITWGVCWVFCALLAYWMKAGLKWDSTLVFAAMAGYMGAILAMNWIVSGVRLPGPEFLALLAVFIMGIVPRLVDGYDMKKPTAEGGTYELIVKDFCSPDNFIQAHALWHILSALALILVFDLLEKSRGDGIETSWSTVVLPQDDRLDVGLRKWLPYQPPEAVLFNVILTVASIVLALVLAVNMKVSSPLMLVLAFLPLVCAILLWLWPLMPGKKKGPKLWS